MLKITHKIKPLVLCILDGWGIARDSPGNAITRAECKNFESLWFSFPHTFLITSGQSVGLPEGHVGDSEVGHINLGAGRIVLQDLMRINTAIADGSFFENESLIKAIEHTDANKSNIHIIGLVGLGSVHSDVEHLYALLAFLKKEGVSPNRIKLHLFTDGRDSPPTSAKIYLSQIQDWIIKGQYGQIATISGRYFAMDRDNRWDRTAKVYSALRGKSENKSTSALDAIEDSYTEGITDEFIKPTVIVDSGGNPLGTIENNDCVIFFNYRPDRARQLTKAFVYDNLENIKSFSGQKVKTFARGSKPENLFFVTLTEYEKNLPVSAVAFKPQKVEMPLARVLSERNLYQLHIAETEKYAHVTYFFNGGHEAPYHGEDRILIDSPKVASYDLKPEMSAPKVTKQLISKINSRVYDFIVVNLANPDMVAHTGNFEATVKAVQAVDFHLGIIIQAALAKNGAVIITSDHGNAEELINQKTGQIDTEHNINPAPCIFVIGQFQGQNVQLPQGLLADVAPTILEILSITKPSQMTGRNLLK